MESLYYAGIGSRNTPEEVMDAMTKLAEDLKSIGWVLRSGGADGADTAFEKGAGDSKVIFLPWRFFNNSPCPYYPIPDKAFEIAEKIHPAWSKLSQGAQRLHARNILQVLGYQFKFLSKFVVCWTPGGKVQGGTATAIKLAKVENIKVFNLYRDDPRKVLEYAKSFEK
jgi:hypothetical protein